MAQSTEQITRAMIHEFDIPAILTLLLLSCACALCGMVLVLRRQSMSVDVMTHAVLPGIAIAFILASGHSIVASALGAFITCILSLRAMDLLARNALISRDCAAGIVLCSFFALGIIVISLGVGSAVHLDTDAVLFGSIEGVYWSGMTSWSQLLNPASWLEVPRHLVSAMIALVAAAAAVIMPASRLSAHLFDAQFATTTAIWNRRDNALVTLAIAATAVSAFQAVGAVMAVALFCAPAIIAISFCRRFCHALLLAPAAAAAATLLSYAIAAYTPYLLPTNISLGVAGVSAVMLGGSAIIVMYCCAAKTKNL